MGFDDDLADCLPSLDEIMRGLHRLGSETIQAGCNNRPDSTFGDECRNCFENGPLTFRRLAVKDLAENHLCMQRRGFQHEWTCIKRRRAIDD